MRRRDLLKHLNACGCRLFREGGKHSVYLNTSLNKVSTVPRHREVSDFLAHKICRDLEIPIPPKADHS